MALLLAHANVLFLLFYTSIPLSLSLSLLPTGANYLNLKLLMMACLNGWRKFHAAGVCGEGGGV